ncbi:MAG: SMP-30/gluconolactonase/LRE family protein [Chloroflexi bacterium]|nr:SMP-30/gluconolactonase/LRE family protein [Chloroflexota bacterium]
MQLATIVVSSEWEMVAGGFQFTEGPLWAPEGYLLFSDIPASTIYSLSPEGVRRVWRYPSGNSNGLTWDRNGRLIACEHGNRRVSIERQPGVITSLADHYGDARLNSPNDVVVRSDGTVYFTDPPYGIQESERELPHNGVYALSPAGDLHLLVSDMQRPNGLALSPDESILYVDDSQRRHIRAFDVQPDGMLAGGEVWAEMASPDAGSPDGMKVDQDGNVWCTGPGGIWVYTPDRELLGILRGPEQPANLAFGGSDRCTLYITARTGIYRLRTTIPGIPA